MPALATGAAPGKVILFGEHAVVYGRPAIAAALGRGLGATAVPEPGGPILHIPHWGAHGLHVRLGGGDRPAGAERFDSISRGFAAALDALELTPEQRRVGVTVDGELPLGVGLGSSAAFAVCLLRTLAAFVGRPLGGEALIQAAHLVEQVFHGTPSGLDHTVVAQGGCLRFRRGVTPPWEALPLAAPVPLVVAWTTREGSTRDVVGRLRARHDRHPDVYGRLFDEIAAVAEAGVEALARGDLERLGVLFDLNHGLLNACGVSTLANESMVALARRHGALGAKLTGAGAGGAVIALQSERPEGLVQAYQAAGFHAFHTEIGGE